MARARVSRSARESPGNVRSPSATIAASVMRGSSEENGSWNTICVLQAIRRQLAPVERRDLAPLEADRALALLGEPHQRAPDGGLARARLAHHRERLALPRA